MEGDEEGVRVGWGGGGERWRAVNRLRFSG